MREEDSCAPQTAILKASRIDSPKEMSWWKCELPFALFLISTFVLSTYSMLRHFASQWEYIMSRSQHVLSLLKEQLSPSSIYFISTHLIYWKLEFVCKAYTAHVIYFLAFAFSLFSWITGSLVSVFLAQLCGPVTCAVICTGPHTQKGTELGFVLCCHSFEILNDFFFWLQQAACGILVPWPGIESVLPAVEAWSLNRWTIGEGPEILNDFWITNPAFHFSLDSANSVASPAQDSLLPTSLFIHLCWFYCCLVTCWADLSLLLWVWSKRKSK